MDSARRLWLELPLRERCGRVPLAACRCVTESDERRDFSLCHRSPDKRGPHGTATGPRREIAVGHGAAAQWPRGLRKSRETACWTGTAAVARRCTADALSSTTSRAPIGQSHISYPERGATGSDSGQSRAGRFFPALHCAVDESHRHDLCASAVCCLAHQCNPPIHTVSHTSNAPGRNKRHSDDSFPVSAPPPPLLPPQSPRPSPLRPLLRQLVADSRLCPLCSPHSAER